MRKSSPFVWILSALSLIALGWGVTLSAPSIAQDRAQDDDDLVILTPGTILRPPTPTRTPIPEGFCFEALPYQPGDVAYIQPGVNVRNAPSINAALVWNTIIENRDDDGRVVPEPVSIEVTIMAGPVCANGYNWWEVVGTGEAGWVAEGRPENYWLVPLGGFGERTCARLYDNAPGQLAQVLYGVRLYAEPDRASRVQTVIPAGELVQVRGGPLCLEDGDYEWWLVYAVLQNVDYVGWMRAGGEPGFWLVPEDAPNAEEGTLCGDPLNFSVGQRAHVANSAGTPRTLRAGPGLNAQPLFRMVDNVPFTIDGGPVCANNLNWWRIRLQSGNREIVGWMAEGSSGVGYWMASIDTQRP